MAWTGGVTRATGDTITAAIWNAHLGASGDLDYLNSTPGALTYTDYTTAAAPAAPGAAKGRFYTVTGDRPGFRSGAAGAAEVLVTRDASETLTTKTLTSPTITTSPTATGATWADLGAVTTIDINGGTIDGITVGATAAPSIIRGQDNAFRIENPAATFIYTLTGGAITADRILNLPVITGADTLAVLALAQTFLTGVKTFNSSILAIRNPADTFSYTIAGAAILADRVLTLPLLAGAGTLAALELAQTWTALQSFGTNLGGTLQTAAQPNVTSLGTLTGLTMGGTLNVNNQSVTNLDNLQFSGAGNDLVGSQVTNWFVRYIGGTNAAGAGARMELFGTGHASAGRAYFYTPNAAADTDTLRLTITGNSNTAIATWSAIYHTGLKFGLAGTATGAFTMDGATSGVVTMTVAAAAGTWTMTLPTTAGSAGQVLRTDGAGAASWVSRAATVFYPHDVSRAQGAATVAADWAVGEHNGGNMADAAKRSSTYEGRFDYAPASVKLVVIPAGTGNMAWYCTSEFAAVGEASTIHTDSLGSDGTPQTTALTNTQIAEIDITNAFTGALAGDYFGLDFIRDGDDASDTVGAVVLVLGLLVTY